MRKLWSFSTTLRSPDRIVDFLRVLLNLENAKWNNENQKKYQTLLIQYRKYVPEKNNLSDESVRILEDINHKMTYEEAKKLTPEQVAALSPERMQAYVNAMRNKFVNENGNKKDGC